MELHPQSRRLLKKLAEKKGKVDLEELESELGIENVLRPAQWLEEKGLVKLYEKHSKSYSLTDTGQEVVKKGLPEKKLLERLEEGSRSMKELKTELDALNIAIGKCKKNGWIEIQAGEGGKKLSITDRGENKLEEGFESEEVLKYVSGGKSPEKEDKVKKLIDRGLLEEDELVSRKLEATDRGRDEAEDIEEVSEEINQLTPDLIRDGNWKGKNFREYNVEADVEVRRPGKKQPYRQYLDEVRKKLLSMGFREAKTSLVEMEFWNFDVLFQAQDHPAREIHDKFELKNPSHGDLAHDEIVERVREMHEKGGNIDSRGWEYNWSKEKASNLMLRSQTTATTIRYLAKGLESPAKVFSIDRNFRYDEIDQTHFVEFYQAEGIVKAPELSLKDLFGYLEVFGKEIGGAEKIRFRPNYFPFTEPSVELDAYHPEIGWMELGGAGLFRPEVRNPLGVDEPVIAWGMGIDRLAMLKLDKDDIRELVFPQDLDYLRKAPAVRL
ncbi:MAG: phenylalanine--tRNA ligase subunit alpha [Candidatus Nanohaloarchaea archaeon]|nr:phenylalanine--tRNA ligase subunit alpha [Candidatus Nanohaloarchaea archaeon]